MITTLSVRADVLACPRAYGDPRLSGVLLDPAAAVPAMAASAASKGGRYADHDARSADFGDAQVSTVDNFTTRSGPPLCSPPA